MNPTLSLMEDLEESIALGTPERRLATLRQVTELLIGEVERLSEEQVAIFDRVIGRLARAMEREARAELARRLAPLAKAPPGVVRSLAHDDIEVARPILIDSTRLEDADLLGIAMARGTGYRQAIAQRHDVSEALSEVLVARGDRPVLHALAGNSGAHLSPESAAVLIDRARVDAELQALLEARADLTQDRGQHRFDLAVAAARRTHPDSPPANLQDGMEQPLARGARRALSAVAGPFDYREALDTISAIALMRPVDEADVAGFAETGRLEEVVCAIAQCAGLSLTTAERLFTVADSDLILIVGKAKGWSWRTLRSLLRLRDRDAVLPHNAKRFADSFENLDPATAQRVLRFVRRRDHSAAV